MSMERYDPQIDEWVVLNNMSTGREGAGLVVVHDKFYCIGGYDGEFLLNTVEKYDTLSATWSSSPSMTTRRSG